MTTGYIDPRGKVLAHVDRLVDWRRGLKPAPVTIEWDLSNRCTLGCDGCHFAHTHTRGPLARRTKPQWYAGSGDLADMDLVRRVVREAAGAGVQGVVWTGGGEPLTHPDWPDALRAAQDAGLQQGMYTHGALLQPHHAAAVAPLTWAVVSIDADTAEAYRAYKGVDQFEAACQGVGTLLNGGMTVGASFLLSAANIDRAEAMLALGRSLGASYVTFRPLVETAATNPGALMGSREWVTPHEAMLRWLAAQPGVELDVARFGQWRDWTSPDKRRYHTCHGIKLNTTITPDGRMWVCPNRRGMPEAVLGDLTVESFTEVWARHTGQWTDFERCRAMCRLNAVNEVIASVFEPKQHEAFV